MLFFTRADTQQSSKNGSERSAELVPSASGANTNANENTTSSSNNVENHQNGATNERTLRASKRSKIGTRSSSRIETRPSGANVISDGRQTIVLSNVSSDDNLASLSRSGRTRRSSSASNSQPPTKKQLPPPPQPEVELLPVADKNPSYNAIQDRDLSTPDDGGPLDKIINLENNGKGIYVATSSKVSHKSLLDNNGSKKAEFIREQYKTSTSGVSEPAKLDVEEDDDDMTQGIGVDKKGGFMYNKSMRSAGSGDWSGDPQQQSIIPDFDNNKSQFHPSFVGEITPFKVFEQFFGPRFYNLLKHYTNLYAEQQNMADQPPLTPTGWTDVTLTEIYKFLAIVLHMSLVKLPDTKDYWTQKAGLQTTFARRLMNRHRFMSVLSMLHLCNKKTDTKKDPLFKVRRVIDILLPRFRKACTPAKHMSLAESRSTFQGKASSNRQGEITSAATSGDWRATTCLKIHTLCESKSGFCLNFDLIHKDMNSRLTESYIHGVAMRLVQPYFNSGRWVYMGNSHSSVPLYRDLYLNRVIATGVISISSEGVDAGIKAKTGHLREGETMSKRDGCLMNLIWKDHNRIFVMLSTGHTNATMKWKNKQNEKEVKIKPVIVHDYQTHGGGVEICDRLMETFTYDRKSKQWWKRIFFYLFKLGVVNAFIMYSSLLMASGGRKPDLKSFMLGIIDGLLLKASSEPTEEGAEAEHDDIVLQGRRLVSRHFPVKYPDAGDEDSSLQNECEVCLQRATYQLKSKGKATIKRKRTSHWCKDCKEHLCIDPCFQLYHTVDDFQTV